MRAVFWAMCALLACTLPATAQTARLPIGEGVQAWPGADYDPAIPSMEQVLGYPLGAEITTHRNMIVYLEALAQAAPDRAQLIRIGRSWQGRDLVLMVISSPDTMARLPAVQAAMQQLGDPRRTDRRAAQELIGNTPAPVWLAYSVHGDEISPTDAALYTAYHLLAARGDARVPTLLDNTVVIINPLQNPDGRERFIASTLSARGLTPDSDPVSAERDQPWPGGRVNHYLFDLNRDWFAQTQPETRAHTAAMLQWLPVAVADIHEMGTDQTYFFPPSAPPTSPYLTPQQAAFREAIGRTNAQWFDRFGIDYFTREIFDLFYPGYGDGWPAYFGAAAMTYEQGSARGLIAERSNGQRLTYADTVWNQTVASLATIEAVSNERARWLSDFYAFHESAIAAGRSARNGRFALIPTQADQSGADRLARLLAGQRIEVFRSEAGFSACGQRFASGTYVIDLAQPAGRLAMVLLDTEVPIEAPFMEEQERRRARGQPDEIYDITAWSLPLMHNLDVRRCRSGPREGLSQIDQHETAPSAVVNPEAQTAFLAPWGQRDAVQLLTGALQAGLTVRSANEAFTLADRRYPAGTLVFTRAGNPADLAAQLDRLAMVSGAEIVGVNDSWVTDGPSFGSAETPVLRLPRIALVWDAPTSPTAAGATRFVLERRFGAAVTVVRATSLTAAGLERFDVIVVPDGDGYDSVLDAEALSGWVSRGGILIGLGRGVRFLADPDHALMSLRREEAFRESPEEEPAEPEDGETTVPGSRIADNAAYLAAIREVEGPPDNIAGALIVAEIDPDHWLSAGAAERVYVLYQGTDIYAPLRLDQGFNIARYAEPDTVRASGAVWPENREQLAFKPFVAIEALGGGYVIAFTADPTTRGLLEGLETLLANAVLRAPAQTVRR
jgi:hypothetical protein